MKEPNKPNIRIGGIDHLVLRCTDLDAMLAFYVDTLGCRVEREIVELGLYQLRAGASLIDLVVVGSKLGGDIAPNMASTNLDHFCLQIETDCLERLRADLDMLGISSAEPARRYGALGFGESVYIVDPQGNQVELKLQK